MRFVELTGYGSYGCDEAAYRDAVVELHDESSQGITNPNIPQGNRRGFGMLMRRTVLRLLPAVAVVAGTAQAQPAALPRLRDAAAAAGLRFGLSSDVTIEDIAQPYPMLVASQCDMLAVNMSWRTEAPKTNLSEPERIDPNIDFANRHGLKLTGMHLFWNESVPAWFETLTGVAAHAAADRHVQQMTGRYAGQVFAWNVANEEVDTRNGDENGMRRSAFTAKLGSDWMVRAFQTARASDPTAILAYNETGLEMDSTYHARRRDAVLRLLDRLQRAGAPISALGLQSHLRLDDTKFDQSTYRRFLSDVASRGLKLLITELDVLDWRGGPDFATRDADVAHAYKDFLAVALDEPAVKAVTVWGLSDRFTWLTAARDPHFGRPDMLPTRPLPFDEQFHPKPAFYALLQALQHAPRRSPG